MHFLDQNVRASGGTRYGRTPPSVSKEQHQIHPRLVEQTKITSKSERGEKELTAVAAEEVVDGIASATTVLEVMRDQ